MYNLKFCRHTLCEFGWQWIGLKQYLFGGIVPVYITFKVEYSVPFQDFINYSSLHTKCLKNELYNKPIQTFCVKHQINIFKNFGRCKCKFIKKYCFYSFDWKLKETFLFYIYWKYWKTFAFMLIHILYITNLKKRG